MATPSYTKLSEEQSSSVSSKSTKKIVKGDNDPFPWRRTIPIYFVTMSDNIALTIVAPFVADLCTIRFGVSEKYVGVAAGFLVGGYSAAVFCSSFLMGHLSDKFGRKPLMLTGSAVGAICIFCFGIAPWYSLALSLRLIAGFCNSNTAITKAVLSDITIGKNRTIAFAYHGAAFALARSVSSAISGLSYGVTFKGVPLLDDPFMMPCLLGAISQLIAFGMNLMCIPETIKKDKAKSGHSLRDGLKEIASDRLLRDLIIVFCFNSFCNGGMLLGIVLFTSLETKYHGLGFTPLENGINFAIFGLVAVLFQIFCFKPLSKRLNILQTYLFGTIMLGVSTLLFPVSGIFIWTLGVKTWTRVATWLLLLIFTSGMSAGFMTCLPVITGMYSNASNPERQGLVMGTAQSFSSGLRAFGPVVSGLIYTPFFLHRKGLAISAFTVLKAPYLFFALMAFGYLICCLFTRRLSKEDLVRISPPKAPEVEMDSAKPKEPKNEEEEGLLTNGDVEKENK